MKKRSRIIITLVILAIVVGSYVALNNYNKNNSKKESNDILLSATKVKNIESFTFKHKADAEYDNSEYTFIRGKDGWYYKKDKKYPLNQSVVEAKAKLLETVSVKRVVEENASNLSQYGLNNPVLTVSFFDGKKDIVYYLGDYNSSTGTYYLQKEGSSTVYLADATLYMGFDLQVWDLIKSEKYPTLDASTFNSVSFEFPGETIVLKKFPGSGGTSTDTWYMLDEAGNPIENSNVVLAKNYAESVSQLSYLREVDYKHDNDKLEKFGLINPDLKITVNYESETAVSVSKKEVSEGLNELQYDSKKETKQFVLKIGNQTSEYGIYEDYYAMSEDSDAIMTVEYSLLEQIISMSKDSLINK